MSEIVYTIDYITVEELENAYNIYIHFSNRICYDVMIIKKEDMQEIARRINDKASCLHNKKRTNKQNSKTDNLQ